MDVVASSFEGVANVFEGPFEGVAKMFEGPFEGVAKILEGPLEAVVPKRLDFGCIEVEGALVSSLLDDDPKPFNCDGSFAVALAVEG